ncbi:MAG: type IV pilin-like G/H family protein [Cyanobacteriota bacterium]|nr:type IV pilin-like G/H family protein [Cyanobacteriota bacterium]
MVVRSERWFLTLWRGSKGRLGYERLKGLTLCAIAALSLENGGVRAQTLSWERIGIDRPSVPAQNIAQNAISNPIGRWYSPDALAGQELTLIFTPEGTLHFIVRLPVGALAAQEFRYEIYPETQPTAIDLTLPTGEVVQTIMALTPNGLRLQIDGTAPGQPRPTALDARAATFEKLSDSIALPAEIVEREVQEQLVDISRAQRTYYLEFRAFAGSVEPLYVDLPMETEDYLYEISPQGDGTESVKVTATAKRDDLRSYTSAVFMVANDRGIPVSVTATCVTDEPSIEPPAMPDAPPIPETSAIQCPAGSGQV